jgi:hypothetical protein
VRESGPERIAESHGQKQAHRDLKPDGDRREPDLRGADGASRREHEEHDRREDGEYQRRRHDQEEDDAGRALEEIRGVLREPVDDLAEAAVHAHDDSVLGADDADRVPAPLHQVPEPDVVDDRVAQRLVPSGGTVGVAADQVSRAPARRDRAPAGARDQKRRRGEERHDQVRHQQVLPEAFRLDARQETEKVQPLPLEEPHGPREHVRRVADVRVGEQQELAPRGGRALGERMRLSEPARRRLGAGDDTHPRILPCETLEDGGGPVGRPVLDGHDLQVRTALSEVPPDRCADVPLLVARGDDDRHERAARRFRCSGEARHECQVQGRQRQAESCQRDRGHERAVEHPTSF